MMIILQSGSSTNAMDAKRSSNREDLKRERTELLERVSEKPKKEKVVKKVHHIDWQEALIEDTEITTLTPAEHIEYVTLEVDPLVKAMYEDDLEQLKYLLATETTNIWCTTAGLIDSIPHAASLLEIGAARNAYKCLSFFRRLLTMPKPEMDLVRLSCFALSMQNDEHHEEFTHPYIDILARANSGQMCYIYGHTMPALRRLYELSRKNAYSIAKNTGNIKLAHLLRPISKKQ